MDHKGQEQIALHRWAVIAEAAGDRLTPGERGALVRQIAARAHTHPDGSARTLFAGHDRPLMRHEVAHVRVNSQIGGPA